MIAREIRREPEEIANSILARGFHAWLLALARPTPLPEPLPPHLRGDFDLPKTGIAERWPY